MKPVLVRTQCSLGLLEFSSSAVAFEPMPQLAFVLSRVNVSAFCLVSSILESTVIHLILL